jgi:hypothetical protein
VGLDAQKAARPLLLSVMYYGKEYLMSETTLRLMINVNNQRMFNNISKLIISLGAGEAHDKSIPKSVLKPFLGWGEKLLSINSINCNFPIISFTAVGESDIDSNPSAVWKLIHKNSDLCLAIIDDSRSDGLWFKAWFEGFNYEYTTDTGCGYDEELRKSVFESGDYFSVSEAISRQAYQEDRELMKLQRPFREYASNLLTFYIKSEPKFTKNKLDNIKKRLLDKGWNVHFTRNTPSLKSTEPEHYIQAINYNEEDIFEIYCLATRNTKLDLEGIKRGKDFIDASDHSKIFTIDSILDWRDPPSVNDPEIKAAMKGNRCFLAFELIDDKFNAEGQEILSLLVQSTAIEAGSNVIEDDDKQEFYLAPID